MDGSFFRDLVARSRDAIVTIDRESTVLFANGGVERTLGYDPAELEGQSLTRLMPERYRDAHREALERYLSGGERELDWNTVELPALHADGHEVPLSITLEEHEYEGQRVFSGIMRDISDRIERERRLEEQNERLEQFAGVVTHDLRDPLNTAQATLALLESRIEADDETAAYVTDLERALDRMDVLIEGVLTLTRSGRTVGERRPVDLATVSERAWDIAGEEGATLALPAEELTVEADEERLRALLENLFRNSVEHGSTGPASQARQDSVEHGSTGSRPESDDGDAASTVRVEVGPLRDDDVTDRTADDGDPITPSGFYVADDGPGIPEDEREAVFDRGHTTTEKGTGLGLSIVRAIAEAHGWEVRLTESEAGGARFEFRVADH